MDIKEKLTKERTMQKRQGDILIIEVDEIPKDAAEMKRDNMGRIVLADGEATGHSHVIRNKQVKAYQTATAIYLAVMQQTMVEHLTRENKPTTEHDGIPLTPGNKMVVRQFEYTPKGLRRVED